LPENHGPAAIHAFVRAPYPSAWLFSGRSGTGKTSTAEIIAAGCAHECQRWHLVGSDLDTYRVKEIENTLRSRSLFGSYAVVVDEADQITHGGQVRLLHVLEQSLSCVWLFTSNEGLVSFEDRFLSRLKCVNFTTQGLLQPGAEWLKDIASREACLLPFQKQPRSSVRRRITCATHCRCWN
jgi:replication-associated recombination protein RarA